MTTIKRYANRKLYDTETGRYVTLEEIGDAIRRGEEVTVIDHATGADLTAVTMVQVIFEREKKIGGKLPKAFLTSLIQTGNTAVTSLRNGLSALLDPSQPVEQEIKRRLKILQEDGLLAMEEFQRLSELLLAPRFRQKPAAETVEIEVTSQEDEAARQRVEQLNQEIEALEKEIESIKSRPEG